MGKGWPHNRFPAIPRETFSASGKHQWKTASPLGFKGAGGAGLSPTLHPVEAEGSPTLLLGGVGPIPAPPSLWSDPTLCGAVFYAGFHAGGRAFHQCGQWCCIYSGRCASMTGWATGRHWVSSTCYQVDGWCPWRIVPCRGFTFVLCSRPVWHSEVALSRRAWKSGSTCHGAHR